MWGRRTGDAVDCEVAAVSWWETGEEGGLAETFGNNGEGNGTELYSVWCGSVDEAGDGAEERMSEGLAFIRGHYG